MKNVIVYGCIAVVMVCISCNIETKSGTPAEKTADPWEAIQKEMAPGAEASNERPFPDVLSEQEVLIKAEEYARKIGALNVNYYLYQKNPSLLTAKIETPVLVYHVPTGTTNTYTLTLVDNEGTMLLSYNVSSFVDTKIDSFEVFHVEGMSIPEHTVHHITKREAIQLMKNQFPDKQISDPIALAGLHLKDSPYSNLEVFWYFAIEDNNRSMNGTYDEYIIASTISGWKNISSGRTNRSVISTGDIGSPHLNWNRMAKLETPLRMVERIAEAQNNGASTRFIAAPLDKKYEYTPIALK